MKPWWLLVNSMFPSDGNKAVFSTSPQTLNQMLIPLSCVVLFSTRPKAEEHSPSLLSSSPLPPSPSPLCLPLKHSICSWKSNTGRICLHGIIGTVFICSRFLKTFYKNIFVWKITSQHVNNADLLWCYIKALMDERLRLKKTKLQSAVILQRHLNKWSKATSVAADFHISPSFPGFRSVLLRAGGNTSQARRATKPWSWCQPNFWAQTASSPEPFHNACCFSQWVVTMATVVPRCRTSTCVPQFVMRRCRLPLGLF